MSSMGHRTCCLQVVVGRQAVRGAWLVQPRPTAAAGARELCANC